MIENGSRVKIHYILTVDDEVVDSSEGRQPLEYVQGSGQIIPGLEEKLAGLGTGDKREVDIQPEKGYGQRDPDGLQKVPRSAFRNADEIKIGDSVSGRRGEDTFQARVAGVTDDDVTLDLNHPLAGKTLHFEVEVVDVS